jgi:LacI family transcriptional regulator
MLSLKEIAKFTGTSPASVSRVLNNSGYVSAERRRIIEKALRENGYQVTSRRNAIPRSADKIILIIVESLQNTPYIEYIQGINTYLQENDHHPLVYVSNHSPENEIKHIEYATALGVGGILMLSAVESLALLNLIKELSCPLVLLNRRLPTADIDSVIMDNYKVGYLATNYLIERGHKNIVHLAGPVTSTAAADRKTGYLDAMKAAGLQAGNKEIFYGNLSYTKSKSLVEQIIKECPDCTAVFSANDNMALGFIDGLYEAGLTCPGDISVICAENTLDTRIGRVKISSVGYYNEQMGRSAAELLLERKREPNGRKKNISYSPVITERESVRDF